MKVIFSTNIRPKTKKIVRAVFEKNIKVSDFGLIWRPFREHLQIQIFFKNPAQWLFYFYSPLASCKKSKKSLELFLKKMFYQPTNQPTNANLETFSRISPNQEFFKNPALGLFYLYSTLTSCKKSEKSFEPFLRNLRWQSTNQPTKQLLPTTPIL